MRIFTIGFTKKTAEHFFETLGSSGVKRVIDVRLRPNTQLAGFAIGRDQNYLLKKICDIDYVHIPELAPEPEMFDEYRQSKEPDAWLRYENQYLDLMVQRRVEEAIPREIFEDGCLLCSEHKADHCHRRLVAEYLRDHWGGVEITHLE